MINSQTFLPLLLIQLNEVSLVSLNGSNFKGKWVLSVWANIEIKRGCQYETSGSSNTRKGPLSGLRRSVVVSLYISIAESFSRNTRSSFYWPTKIFNLWKWFWQQFDASRNTLTWLMYVNISSVAFFAIPCIVYVFPLLVCPYANMVAEFHRAHHVNYIIMYVRREIGI
jgi:hypothetical protein